MPSFDKISCLILRRCSFEGDDSGIVRYMCCYEVALHLCFTCDVIAILTLVFSRIILSVTLSMMVC